jgi:hypothetical protein
MVVLKMPSSQPAAAPLRNNIGCVTPSVRAGGPSAKRLKKRPHNVVLPLISCQWPLLSSLPAPPPPPSFRITSSFTLPVQAFFCPTWKLIRG